MSSTSLSPDATCGCSWCGNFEGLEEGQEHQDVRNIDYSVAVDVALRAGGASKVSEHAEQILDGEFSVSVEIAWVRAVAIQLPCGCRVEVGRFFIHAPENGEVGVGEGEALRKFDTFCAILHYGLGQQVDGAVEPRRVSDSELTDGHGAVVGHLRGVVGAKKSPTDAIFHEDRTITQFI